ncbi:hypothetical protein [Elioraea rosea]|uniref:hypothetical protein n=1 Tax=Elioraea rosea TaxID=2492390 RepID=UPI0011871C25|nr:hypothetical protein [Elioraea rosea]
MIPTRMILAAAALVVAFPALAQQAPQRPAQPQRPTQPQQAQAQAQAQGGPSSIGRFDDWEAATLSERGQKVCYAFTRAAASAPAVQGRGEVVLVLTHRGRSRDEVAVRAGYTYPNNAEPAGTVEASSGNIALAFFAAGEAAFARDRAAAVNAFERGRSLRLAGPGPRGGTVTDVFSLRGFTAARRAIGEACK